MVREHNTRINFAWVGGGVFTVYAFPLTIKSSSGILRV